MVRAEVVYLLVPAGYPELLADKLDRVKRVAKQGSVTTQSIRAGNIEFKDGSDSQTSRTSL